MQVILLEKVQNLGKLGDTVKVRPGYGRNYLIPSGKAVPATEANIAKFEQRRAELEKAEGEALASANERKAAIEGIGDLVLARKAGDEGKLFGSVGTTDIAEAIASSGADVSRNEIRMPEGAIRDIGEYEIGIHLHADVDAIITLKVVAE